MMTTSVIDWLTPWLPVVDDEWELAQVKNYYDIILGKMLQNTAQSFDDVEIPYLKAQHVQWDRVRIEDLPTMWASPWEIEVLRVREGDLLICEGGEAGRATTITDEPPIDCIIQNALHLVRPKEGGETRFLKYLLEYAAGQAWLDVLCNRATIAHFTVEKFREMWIWLPPALTQRDIAAYLDRETANIDARIHVLQERITLLTEKRRALITHAVTRGLNPSAPMKDSGVAWIGEMPEHWSIESFVRFLNSIVDYRGRTPEKTDEGVFLVTARNIRDGHIDYSASQEYISSDIYEEVMSRGKPKLGDILFTVVVQVRMLIVQASRLF